MPISSAGRINNARGYRAGVRGITLVEMMIVVTIVALIAGISFPSVASGVDAIRLRSASDEIVSFFTQAVNQAERKQKALELRVTPKQNKLTARSIDLSIDKTVVVEDPVRIVAVQGGVDERRFLIYPGGAVPGVKIELETQAHRRRTIEIDPVTGLAEAR